MAANARRIALGLVPALLVVGLGGCTGSGPNAQDAAKDFAVALAAHDISKVSFTDMAGKDAQEHMSQVFDALGDDKLGTKVSKVTVDDSDAEHQTATATISYSWQVTDERAWTYDTSVDLKLVDSDGKEAWEVVWAPDMLVPDLASGERLAVTRLQATRADILDRNGNPLVTERAVNHVGIDKTHADPAQWDAQARALAGVVGIDPDAYAKQVADAGPKAFVEAITLRQEQTPDLSTGPTAGMSGVSAIPDEMPLAPTSTFARPILGVAGDATKEIVDSSDGAVVAGDTVGLSGIQRQYDAQLRGIPGVSITTVPAESAKDAKGVELFHVDPIPGTPLKTTFDTGLQERAESLLADVATPSAIVAIQPSTGAVLTAASGPGGNGLSTATLGQYAPGSTFKVATALAALRGGTTPDSSVSCTPQITAGGFTFNNVPDYPSSALGDIPFRTAFANSCNTAMISLAGQVSQQSLHDAAADLGIGVPSDLGAPAYFGDVPTSATDVEHAASMIGQAKIQASPLTMATVAASVAKGERVSPILVQPDTSFASDAGSTGGGSGGADGADGGSDGSGGPTASGSASGASGASPSPSASVAPSKLTSAEADTLRSLMQSVVSEGSASVLSDLGNGIGAKTGTAQYGDGSQSHAWMIAFDGDLAVAVFLETGETGATSAGPIMHAFLAG